MLKTLKVIILSLAFQFGFQAEVFANDGYFLCTPPQTIIDGTLGIALGTAVNYDKLGVLDAARGKVSSKSSYLALNFLNFPYKIEARSENTLFQSGEQVFRSRELVTMKSAIGTHSGVTLYHTVAGTGFWPMVSASSRNLRDGLLPTDLNSLGQGKAYVLVERKVGLIGFAEAKRPQLSFCIKQNDVAMTGANLRNAYMQLMKEFKTHLESQVVNSENIPFVFNDDLHTPLATRHREIIVEGLFDFFENKNYVFKSQYGRLLTVGALLSGASLMVALKFSARESNPALALLPPEVIDEFFVRGKKQLYAPVDDVVDFKQLRDFFAQGNSQAIIDLMQEDPRTEAYLRQLLLVLLQQIKDPNQI